MMGNSSNFDPISRLHLAKADSAMLIGHAMTMPGRNKGACAVCCVVHRGSTSPFTHVYLVPVDSNHRGEVFLAKVLDGERVAEALNWSARNLVFELDDGARRAA